jgi:hypothetical protein
MVVDTRVGWGFIYGARVEALGGTRRCMIRDEGEMRSPLLS